MRLTLDDHLIPLGINPQLTNQLIMHPRLIASRWKICRRKLQRKNVRLSCPRLNSYCTSLATSPSHQSQSRLTFRLPQQLFRLHKPHQFPLNPGIPPKRDPYLRILAQHLCIEHHLPTIRISRRNQIETRIQRLDFKLINSSIPCPLFRISKCPRTEL